MLKFVGLRLKLYSFNYENLAHYEMNEGGEKKNGNEQEKDEPANKNTAKGVKNHFQSNMAFDDYARCFQNMGPLKKEIYNQIRSS